MSDPLDLDEVAQFLRDFAAERDWEQFHTPKNLAMALAGEAGELLEIFQWLTPNQSAQLAADVREHVGEELADILQYVVRIADVLDVDVAEAVWSKLRGNEQRYAADEVRGKATKK